MIQINPLPTGGLKSRTRRQKEGEDKKSSQGGLISG